MKIAMSSDHAGYDLKGVLKSYIESKGHEVKDFGPENDSSVDYPDYGHPVAEAVKSEVAELGIVMCGSGNGINMTMNKHQEIRSALCWTSEISHMARLHNNANVLALPARYISEDLAKEIVDQFLETAFEGGRHQRRVEKIACGS